MKFMTKQDHAPFWLFQPRLAVNQASVTIGVMDVCRPRVQVIGFGG